jgi:hypothetical protein
MLKRSPAILLALAVAAGPLGASADAAGDLAKIRAAFAAAKSWHATEQLPGGKTVNVDYVAPDRWRIQPTPQFTELLIGNDVYMIHNGKTTRMPIPGGTLRKTISSFYVAPLDEQVKSSAKDLGMQTVNGQALHAYSFTEQDSNVKLYVGNDFLPVQSVVTTPKGEVTINYSGFNTAIDISP